MRQVDWIQKLEAKRGRDSLTCVFCNSHVQDESQYGKLYCRGKTTVHYFCLLLASKLDQKGSDREGILGFMVKDIEKQVQGAINVCCCYCNKGGATVYCCGNTCEKVFHLPCGLKEQSFHEFFGRFRSFCYSHRRVQMIDKATLIEAAKVPQICTICYDTVIPKPTSGTLWAPCCKKNAWFHKTCVQSLALNAGYFFKCPLCNNKRLFHSVMRKNGIFIPEQDASWERVPHAFDDMYTTYKRCDAVKCHCKKGRSFCERRTMFEIIVCKYCGSQGVHKICGGLKSRERVWGCPVCTNTVASGSSRFSSTTSDAIKSCSGITFNVQDFLSSSVSRRFLPHVCVEKTLTVPPSIRIGEASLKILKRSYQSWERCDETTTLSKPQVLQCDVHCLSSKNDLSIPGSTLREQEAAHAPKNTDNCNRKVIEGHKINGICMKVSSDTRNGSATDTIHYLRKRSGICDLKYRNQTRLTRNTGPSATNCQNNVNSLSDTVKIDNIHDSTFQMGRALASDSVGYKNSTAHDIGVTEVTSPESKKIKREKIYSSNIFTRELRHLGAKGKHVHLNRMSFTRSGISYLA